MLRNKRQREEELKDKEGRRRSDRWKKKTYQDLDMGGGEGREGETGERRVRRGPTE